MSAIRAADVHARLGAGVEWAVARSDEMAPATVDARAVVVHERLTELGGSERVVAHLLSLFTEASLFVPIADPRLSLSEQAAAATRTSPLQRLYGGGERYAHLLPLLPLAMSRARFSPPPDVVVTSHHAFANRVRPPSTIPLISYTHSPARWMWQSDMRDGEGRRGGQALLGAFAASQRRSDRAAAARANTIVANSHAVADRIRDWWGRDAVVVHPPVDVTTFCPAPVAREDFFLLAGRMVPYKRPGLAVEAARRAGVPLVVVGDGRARADCEAIAGPGTEFLGRVSTDTLVDLFRRCKALVFPGEEDFGLIPVEAQACGAPVIALGAGGALDTVLPGRTGTLVPPGPGALDRLTAALASMRADEFDSVAIRRHAETFSTNRFRREMSAVINNVIGEVPRAGRPA